MGRLTREQQAYADAYNRIVSVAEKEGAEAAIAEARRRCISGTPPHIDKASERDFCEKVKHTILQTVLILALVTLRDEFGFGEKRLNQFKERFHHKAECLQDMKEVDWTMMMDILREECNVDTEIDWLLDGEDPTKNMGK